jgi:hypothetical protein
VFSRHTVSAQTTDTPATPSEAALQYQHFEGTQQIADSAYIHFVTIWPELTGGMIAIRNAVSRHDLKRTLSMGCCSRTAKVFCLASAMATWVDKPIDDIHHLITRLKT